MEALEKIYISTNSQDGTYYISNQYKRLIEYTCTDAFIEKACEWLRCNNNLHDGEIDNYVNDFRKYMKGE